MNRCMACAIELKPEDEFRARERDTDAILIFCGFEHCLAFSHEKGFHRGVEALESMESWGRRGVVALESIAASLETLAKPRAPKTMPPGMAQCTKCVAVVPIGKIQQHHEEVHSG